MVSVVETSYKTAAAPVLSLMCDPSVKHAIWKGLRCWRCCLRSLIRESSLTQDAFIYKSIVRYCGIKFRGYEGSGSSDVPCVS